ncbi:50S ribosomal protein L11 methyltransferase [Rhizobium sp. EC-SD404]|uniref:50S ribosomal protein L11 methyltransferase n=1 Tax=Rhizobium sp. EC-SD404 TaxID=2038389 RepID=UPI0012551955|nr:50S ribosomal protein L11 methyltransferase [Rhizobium sp. EC-SD404]VVT26249.1 Ribosomal protein L11 methyltransferase [Rhizobium sp. EC-SD404]
MSQKRLFVKTSEIQASRILDILSNAFEEDGFPVATSEIDERAGIWEASIYADETEIDALRDRVAAVLLPDFGALTIEYEDVPDIDWVRKSLEGLKPVRAGRFLVHGSHDRGAIRPGDLPIEIDAGQAFGTGHHGTTSGCLEMIDEVVRRRKPKRALDLGTGSGVLAIAVAQLSNARVVATDIDPIAVKIAAENAQLNEVGARIKMRTAPGFQARIFKDEGPFDLIVANILARPLISMAPELVRHLAPGGSVILSGILAEQRWKVLSAYNGQALAHRKTLWREGWVTLHLS